MIKIVMTNGCTVTWGCGEYTDYKYDGKFFIIMKNENWIGFYNLDHVIHIEVEMGDEEESTPHDDGEVLTQEEVMSLLDFLKKPDEADVMRGEDGVYAIFSNLPRGDLKKLLKDLNGKLDNEALAGD